MSIVNYAYMQSPPEGQEVSLVAMRQLAANDMYLQITDTASELYLSSPTNIVELVYRQTLRVIEGLGVTAHILSVSPRYSEVYGPVIDIVLDASLSTALQIWKHLVKQLNNILLTKCKIPVLVRAVRLTGKCRERDETNTKTIIDNILMFTEILHCLNLPLGLRDIDNEELDRD